MIAQVVPMEKKRTYRNAAGEERPCFNGIPDWLHDYIPQVRPSGWTLLTIILRHQRMGTRSQPVAISLRQFQQESGLSLPAVQKALSDIARAGLLYEELEDPTRKDSTICYAILAQPNQGPTETEEGVTVELLDGWYDVDPVRVVHRVGVKVPCTPTNSDHVCKELSQGDKESFTPRSRIFHTWAKVSLPPPAAQPSQEAASSSLERREREEREEEGPQPPPPANPSHSQIDSPHQPTRSRRRKPLLGATLFSANETETLLNEAKDLIRELHKSATWAEEEDEVAGWLDTLLRVKQYPVPWLLDEASAYRGYKPKKGRHTWDGFEKWCRNTYAQRHLEEYRLQQRARQNGQAPVKRPTTEEDRAANAAARADAERLRQQPRKLPNYLS